MTSATSGSDCSTPSADLVDAVALEADGVRPVVLGELGLTFQVAKERLRWAKLLPHLRQKCRSVTAVAQEASANKATVTKVLGQRYIPLENNLYKGVYRVPKTSDGREAIPPNAREDLFDGEIAAATEPSWWEEEL